MQMATKFVKLYANFLFTQLINSVQMSFPVVRPYIDCIAASSSLILKSLSTPRIYMTRWVYHNNQYFHL